MHVSINYEREIDDNAAGAIKVGWLRKQDKTGVLYDPPERVSFRQTNRKHPKSASRCPAVIQMESRFFFIKCPFDLHIGFGRNEKGPHIINRSGAESSVRSSRMGNILKMVDEAEWRYPDRPTIQMILPYIFVADETVYITQLDAFAHYRKDPLPGTIFGGRFPINLWPRPLMWAFEWHEPKKDILLRRGDPLFYCQFEGTGPDRPIQMVEAQRTAELQAYIDHISGAVSFANQTFSLFEAAEAARPTSLLVPKKK